MLWKPTYSRMFFSLDGDGAGGSGSGTQQGGQSGTAQNQQGGQSQNGDASGQQGGEGQQGSQSTASKMLSQDEVNKLIEDRLTRAKAKWDKDAQTVAERKKESELPEIEQLRKKLDQAEKERETFQVKQREADGREAVRSVAKKFGASEDTLNAVYRMVKNDIEFDVEGDPANVNALLTEAKQIAPQLFRPVIGKGDGGSGNGGKPAADSDFMRAALDRRGR